ncbi:hypothetical protein [Streptomyces sp. NPDC006552]|uniref:hypothetical protein n=1 Tax=Streptomyces sp. NPDC006552 TaxID=3157179 RepID=UPI0033A5E644
MVYRKGLFRFLVVASIVLLAGRIGLVECGVLYGRTRVLRVDGLVAAVAVLALAVRLAARRPPPPSAPAEAEVSASPADRWNIVTAATGLLVLAVSAVSLFSPVDEPGIPKASCANARTRGTQYLGLTSGEFGNNTREGPGRAFAANGRFPPGCSVGFADYCLGDPILDDTGSTEHQEWATGRWLRLSKSSGWLGDVAHVLSAEDPSPQFISDAFIVPADNYERLRQASDAVCGPQRRPGKAKLGRFVRVPPRGKTAGYLSFSATSDHAVNIGFAVYLIPGQGFREEGLVMPLYDDSRTAPENPGRVAADKGNRKAINWTYSARLQAGLKVGQKGAAHVLVMAIPCISDNLAEVVGKADIGRYDITPKDQPVATKPHPEEYDHKVLNRLARAACQANV